MNLLNLFDLSLTGRADTTALEWNGAEFTFGEIERRSNRVANALRERGFRKGDRLCVYLANRIELIDIFLACVKLGVIFVPINILYREREIDHIVRDAEPRAMIGSSLTRPLDSSSPSLRSGSESLGATLSPLRGARDIEVLLPACGEKVREARMRGDEELLTSENDERPAESLDGDTPAAIIYTSGTTGTSKGAILTHNNFISNCAALLAAWEISSADRLLLALPLFHIHALGNGLLCWLASGCRMRLLERFDHRTAADAFLDFHPTLFFGVPTIYVRLLDAPREIARGMRLFVSGSAPLPAHVFEQFRERFGHTILERYGMTEAFMIMSNPYVGERRAGTVGFPLPGVSARIVEGELQVRGPAIFAGYWRNDAATAAAFDGPWFKTGDVASVSDDGYYTLLGRKSDLIISGGFNIYPREIEDLLTEQRGVTEAAVVGIPDDIRGEVPVAYIVGDAGPEELERVCRASLASFKVPRQFIRVESIPRTALGKVQKHRLGK